MADEPQQQPVGEAPAPETEAAGLPDDDFDWEHFFLGEGDAAAATPPAPPVAPVEAPPIDEGELVDGDEQADPRLASMVQQIADLEQRLARTADLTTTTETRIRMSAAIEAWKQQASPAELTMAENLTKAKTPDELKMRAEIIKEATKGFDNELAARTKQIERELQRTFGLPTEQDFQPIPESEKMRQALENGDIDSAATAAMRGFFD